MSWTIKTRGAPSGAGFKANHRCNDCWHIFEVTLPSESDHDTKQQCPACAKDMEKNFGPTLYGQSWNTERTYETGAIETIVRGNSDYSERQGERLAKRSRDHFRREGHEEAIERQRAQFKREGLVS